MWPSSLVKTLIIISYLLYVLSRSFYLYIFKIKASLYRRKEGKKIHHALPKYKNIKSQLIYFTNKSTNEAAICLSQKLYKV